MTTAHRPTFDPARGKSNQAQGSILHARSLPSHSTIKYRQEGQGGDADKHKRELERELFDKEQKHSKKLKLETGDDGNNEPTQQEIDDRRQQILREMQADSDSENDEDPQKQDNKPRSPSVQDKDKESEEADMDEGEWNEVDSDEVDSDDEQELLIELEKIKRERAKEKQKQQELQQQAREREIAYGNPLLNPKKDFAVKKSWMDDTVFKNQNQKNDNDRGFINDMLRSDFHKRFMDKYVK